MHAHGEKFKAAQILADALTMAEPGGFIRIFVDETQPASPLIEPLSERELEVLHLIDQGLSNREISERLYLALSTVKGHNRNIFDNKKGTCSHHGGTR